ncbi:Hypothetical protein FKW44_011924 [Caligus rogercresseyi]|uniref:Uncharacterized protein n=1 Tax=Caligus rogercresseyi TaxID=217165 RepID=A0A7T8HJ07_CALRO|nr:Hypothetical protein FKW44_011924 [Caligus rogercresseyi]
MTRRIVRGSLTKVDKKEIVEIVGSSLATFYNVSKALKDGNCTGRTLSSGGANKKRTEDFLGRSRRR